MKHFCAVGAALISSTLAFTCTNLTIPVDLSARNGVFDYAAPQTNIEVTNFFLKMAESNGNYSETLLLNYTTVSRSYELAATYCVPINRSSAPPAVQLLTHGIGFDRSYWDLAYNAGNYSYIAIATDRHGYATLSWDRLGTGQSSHGDPIQEIQAPLEVDGLRALSVALREGKIPGVPQHNKVFHVGHSYGSTHTYALTAKYPWISDGIALTGFSQDGSYVSLFELAGNFVDVKTDPTLAPHYPHGYLTIGDPTGVQTNFFAPNAFDPKILDYAVSIGKPLTIGELLTFSGDTATNNAFDGAVLIVTGEHDIPFCGRDCYQGVSNGSSIPAQAQQFFTNTTISSVVIPDSGHALNLEYSHPSTYQHVNDFFDGILAQR